MQAYVNVFMKIYLTNIWVLSFEETYKIASKKVYKAYLVSWYKAMVFAAVHNGIGL